MTKLEDIDPFNKFGVGTKGKNITITFPCKELTKTEALTFAAWIVTLADPDDEFGLHLEKVQSA